MTALCCLQKVARFQAQIREIHRYGGPRGPPLKAVGHIAANYRAFFKLSLSPKHPRALSELALAAVANGCWQPGHLFNPSAEASQGD